MTETTPDRPTISVDTLELREITQEMAKQKIPPAELSGTKDDNGRYPEKTDRAALVAAGITLDEQETCTLAEFLSVMEKVHPATAEKLVKERLSSTALAQEVEEKLTKNHAFGLFVKGEVRPRIVVYTALHEESKPFPAHINLQRWLYQPNLNEPGTITFYSISSMDDPQQPIKGLGQAMINRVAEAIKGQSQIPDDLNVIPKIGSIETLSTLSPLTPKKGGKSFREWYSKLDAARKPYSLRFIDKPTSGSSFADQLDNALTNVATEKDNKALPTFTKTMQGLVLEYLTEHRDFVQGFHQGGNGALLAGVHPFTDMSENGITQSLGCMVNYVYDLDKKKHEDRKAEFILGKTPMTPELQEILDAHRKKFAAEQSTPVPVITGDTVQIPTNAQSLSL